MVIPGRVVDVERGGRRVGGGAALVHGGERQTVPLCVDVSGILLDATQDGVPQLLVGLALLLHGLFTLGLVIWCVRRRGSFLLLNAFTSFLSRFFLSCALRLDNGKLFFLHVSVLENK